MGSRLHLAQEKTSSILDRISEGYFVLDAEFKITDANSAALKWLNKEKSFLLGSRFQDLLTKEERKKLLPYYSQLAKKRKPLLFETSFNGSWFSVHAYPEQNNGLTVFFINLSEIHKAEEELKSKNDFISIASHELKTPLTALSLQVEMAKKALEKNDGALSPEKIKNIMNRTHQDVLRMSRLVDDMLDISRIDTGKLNMNFEFFALDQFIEEFLERAAHGIVDPDNLKVSVNAPVLVKWDKFRIEQVLINLLTNASRYGSNSPIELSVSQGGGSAVITVKDYGPGIPKEQQKTVFDKYERGQKKEQEGLGLGLYISSEIIKLHHGSICLQSEEGKGTLFELSLPLITTE